jgi:hypothetical protein
MKKLVFENERAVHELNTAIANGKPIANDLAAEFNKLPLQKISTPGHIIKMLEDLPGFIEAMLPDGERVKIMGVTLKPARIVELMDLDLQPLKSKVTELKKSYTLSALNVFIELAKHTKGKGFEVDPDKLAERLETFRYYAETPKQLEVQQTFEMLTTALNRLLQHGVSERRLLLGEINKLVTFENGQFHPKMSLYSELAN